MIEEKEELQGQLIASGQIVGSLIGCKGEKGDKGDTGNSATITVGTVTTGSPGTQATVTNVGTSTDAIFDFVIPRGQDGSGGGGGGDMYKSTYDQNDNGIVDNAEKVNNHTVQSDVPANAVFTDTTYTAGTGISISAQNVISNTQTSAKWGDISGTLANQTDLNTALGNKIDKSNTTGLVKNDGTIDTTTYSTFSGSYNDLSNKPTIPDELADLSDDSTHRVVTDTEKNTWSGKQDALVSGTNIKTINSTSLLGSGNLDVGANIPIQDTAPQDPEEDDLWIDTSEPEELSARIVNEASNSTTDTYSCNYTNALVDFIRTNKTTEPIGTNRDCLMINSETTKGINLFYNPANAPVQNNMIMWKSFITDYNAPNGYWTYIVVAIALDSHTMWLNAYHMSASSWTGWQQL